MAGELQKHLSALAKELQCSICLDVFETPVSLPCSHQFCSDCIDESLRIKSECPMCRAPTFKRSIWKNNKLQNIVDAFNGIKEFEKSLTNGNVQLTEMKEMKENQNPTPILVDTTKPVKRERTETTEVSPIKKIKMNSGITKLIPAPKVRPPSKCKTPVILCTGLCESYNNRVKELCTAHGGTITKSISNSVTHVVTQTCTSRMETRRTLKYLQGILKHCWVVGYEWIENSSSCWVDETDFEVSGDTMSGKGGPKKSRKNKNCNLFASKKFYLHGKFQSPPPKELKLLGKLGGASFITNPKKGKPIILIDEGAIEEDDLSSLCDEFPNAKAILSYKWLLDSISNFDGNLNFGKYLVAEEE